jgi:hypothetical protein
MRQNDFAPLAPQNLTRSIDDPQGDAHPRLDWDKNQEADLDRYEIWKKPSNESWDLYDTTTDTFFVDDAETGVGLLPCANCSTISYKIRAVDFEDHESDFSSSVSFHHAFEDPSKPIGFTDNGTELVPHKIMPIQNYPNPFNPETTVRFSLPEDQHVKLSIHSITGELVTILVDEYMQRGLHETKWNGQDGRGNDVSSGIYFDILKAGGHLFAKKMILSR